MQTRRREFLVKSVQGTAIAACGGLLWGHLLRQEAVASVLALRPPGALPEADFAAQCIKCGQCANACPYDTLKMATAGSGMPIGTPYFEPRKIPCYMCTDIPCVPPCPTGALSRNLKDITKSRMGLAVIDEENCLSWLGLRCEVCYRVCPVKGRAITIENHPRQISKHAMFVPLVHGSDCTGCGLCEQACPTQVAAIRIINPSLVQGKIGEHYRLGWKQENEITQDFQTSPGTPPMAEEPPAPKTAPGMDTLNQGIEY